MTDKARIAHILGAIQEVETYVANITYQDFLASSEKRFATIKQIEIIDEACNQISQAFKDSHAQIEWKGLETSQYMNTSVLTLRLFGKSPKTIYRY